MVADETVLILALPGDTADTLLKKVGQSGGARCSCSCPTGCRAYSSRPSWSACARWPSAAGWP